MAPTRFLPLLLLSACGTALTWDGAWVEDPAPSGPPELRAYKDAHYRALGTKFVGSLTFDQFAAKLDSKRALYLGDRHEDRKLHRAQLAVLTELGTRSDDLIVAIEAVGTEDQASVDAYLAGAIELSELRDLTLARWSESWLDRDDEVDGAFYRGVLELARERRIPVVALEPAPRRPLGVRAGIMADRLRQIAANDPHALIVVLVGHAHLLGERHLVDLAGLPATVVGARLNRSLTHARDERSAPPASARFERTDAGVLFFTPSALR